jgi:hypothetical protein
MRSRRYAMSMAATFGGIHFYTQWFEGLRTTPQMMIAAGIVAVAVQCALLAAPSAAKGGVSGLTGCVPEPRGCRER